jgi:ATP-dependent DNA helicase RecG
MTENQNYEKKSIKLITAKNPSWKDLAKDCVCFANSRGGVIIIGIEDNESNPPLNQKITNNLVDTVRKRISDLTINVATIVKKDKHQNGAEIIHIEVLDSASSVASTIDGQYYMRTSDVCKPIPPDALARLFTDKPAFMWETKVVQKITVEQADQNKLHSFINDIKESDRTSSFIKNKDLLELLSYYQMIDEGYLTNLGVLWIGKRENRAKLLYAPIVQFIKYDKNGNKVKKIVWDDFSLNPKELVEDIWHSVPEWKEGIEISDGIFGRRILNFYNEDIVRELIINALVHRPYTTSGDIFINWFTDKLEIHNPGPLPVGVTPNNILHETKKRNLHLAKLFYDLKLMETEGSGFDKVFEIQLSEAKPLPIVEEYNDRVTVTIVNQITNVNLIEFIEDLKQKYVLNRKEIISLGLIAQNKSMLATEFSKTLQFNSDVQMQNWIRSLLKHNILKSKGKTKGTEYYINPKVLRNTEFANTNLKKIQPHRLKELILEDLSDYSISSIDEIHERVGKEIPIRKIRTTVYELAKNGAIKTYGSKKFRKYFIDKN